MNASGPSYLLFSDAKPGLDQGRWRFVLRHADGSQRLVAEDVEPGVQGERLELLTVVRGLESLEQPSRVTLMTTSSYVREGIRRGLAEWRENGWRWECFGRMVPVKNQDLWMRMDRAMQFHEIDCRTFRFDPPHREATSRPEVDSQVDGCECGSPPRSIRSMSQAIRRGLQCCLEWIASGLLRRLATSVR